MVWTKLKRVARSGLLNFFRSPVIALASIITLTITLFMIGSLYLSAAFFRASIQELQNKVDISVSFKQDVPEKAVLDLEKSLKLLPEVQEVTYGSREQELADFRRRNADNDLELQLLDELGNPFGARLNIRAVDPAHYESIAKFLNNENNLTPGVSIIDKVSFKRDIVDRLVNLVRTAREIGFVLVLILVFISLVVTFNTISLAIYISREEISLMKLVGASANYIRGPFLMEGVISGFISALLAVGLLYPGVLWLRDATANIYGGFNLAGYFSAHFATLLGLLLGSGIILGILASFMATRQHLKT